MFSASTRASELLQSWCQRRWSSSTYELQTCHEAAWLNAWPLVIAEGPQCCSGTAPATATMAVDTVCWPSCVSLMPFNQPCAPDNALAILAMAPLFISTGHILGSPQRGNASAEAASRVPIEQPVLDLAAGLRPGRNCFVDASDLSGFVDQWSSQLMGATPTTRLLKCSPEGCHDSQSAKT